MTDNIHHVTTTEINTYGHVCRVTGSWHNKPYDVTLYCEYDGREVDSETPNGGYNPMHANEAPTFFDTLCEDQRFIDLHNAGYEVYEKIPHSDNG